MDEIVIVAIPAEDDPVWKVSSEKVPHLTICYLQGPLGNEENTIRFVEHTVKTSLSRFGLSVDRRGTLGSDDADVLFFDKNYGGKELLSFRGFLLTNKDILEAYRKAPQYPMWTPHLTLGYPATPAKPNPNDYGLNWVNFDRIAIWTGDYEGPEFVLKKNDLEMPIDASWSIEETGDFLQHFGVRGMRWGVRRAVNPSTGLVKGTVEGAIRGGQTPRVDSKASTPARGKKASGSADHQKMVENLSKKVEDLSTSEIQALTSRIKAVDKLASETASLEAAKASKAKKLTKWALGQVQEGARKSAESYIQEFTGDVLKRVLPKTDTQKAKDEKERQAQEDRADRKRKEEEQRFEKFQKEARAQQAKANPSQSREGAVNDLVNAIMKTDGSYGVTSLPPKEE